MRGGLFTGPAGGGREEGALPCRSAREGHGVGQPTDGERPTETSPSIFCDLRPIDAGVERTTTTDTDGDREESVASHQRVIRPTLITLNHGAGSTKTPRLTLTGELYQT